MWSWPYDGSVIVNYSCSTGKWQSMCEGSIQINETTLMRFGIGLGVVTLILGLAIIIFWRPRG